MSNDRSIALKGGFWTSVSSAVTMGTTFARVMILTRFLQKSDFGVVSIINMVIGLCITFTDLGFASVIMYKHKLTQREFSTLFWTQLFLFVLIYLVICSTSSLISTFYDESTLSILIPIASLSVICQAFGKLYDSLLQKQYKFRLLAYRNIISNLASLIVAWLMAAAGYGVYSLIFSTLSQTIILNIWNFIYGYKIQQIRFVFNFREIIPLIKIGIYQTGTRILDFLSSKLDVMIIGKLLGTESLGVYDLAKELVFKLVDFIRSVVSKVALPILTNNNSNDDSVRSKFLNVTKIVATLCIPLCLGIVVFSKDLVHVVYGEQYLDIAPIVSVFSVITIFTSITCFFDMLGIAKGRTDLNFKNTIYRIIITSPVVFLCSHISILAVSIGQLLATIIMTVIFWKVVVMNTYPISVRQYLSQFSKLLIVVVLISLLIYCVSILENALINNLSWIIKFSLNIILYFILLILGTRFFLMKDLSDFIQLIKRK